MKRVITLLLISAVVISTPSKSQTWTGSISTAWNNAANWSTGTVPNASGNVMIPGSVASGNWPVFAANVLINTIDMQAGSQLDVNGFSLTMNGVNNDIFINGASINNSNAGSDIVFNINTGTGGFITYFRSNTINDNMIFNITGNNQFIEGAAAPGNIYNGSVQFNINDVMAAYISYAAASQFNGNLTVNRNIPGVTSLFYSGGTVTGNFSYTNNLGSSVSIGNAANKTSISGAVNITAHYPSPSAFTMLRVVNQTGGGVIDVQNPQGFTIQNDTLLVTDLSITGYRGNQYANLINNSITGNITIADDASYGNGFLTYIRNNVITGNSSFSVNGSNTFFEADVAGSGNIYNGNLAFNGAGGNLFISNGAPLQCSGNLSINRTVSGLTSAFNAGADIGGNFTYTNNTAGETGLGTLAANTSIGGTVNITANFTTPDNFGMHRLVNQTNGGSITVTNSLGFSVQNDTLLVNTLSITGYRGNQYGYLINNSITGNVTIADDAGYANGFLTFIRNNTINGNSSFTISGINTFAESDGVDYGNRYNGNLTFNCAGSANVYISYLDTLQCTGNLTINRTAAGLTSAFNSGAVIGGNFTYTNNTAGETGFGNLANKTSIGGLINITANLTTPNNFGMHRLVNQTNGGSINVTNSLGFSVMNDTLMLSEINITGYKGGQYAYLFNNAITGNVTIADHISYSGGYNTLIRNNTINGNSSFTISGVNSFAEADGVGFANRYNGNVSFAAEGPASIYIAYLDTLHCSGNVNISRTAAGQTLAFNAGATINGNFSYTNNTGGETSFGNLASKTSIGGTVNITAVCTTPNNFVMHRLVNQTNGGSITVTNSHGFSVQNDTLLVNALRITGYRGNQYGYFYNNVITGNVTTADDASYAGGYYTYFRGNTINGNTSITNNGSNTLLDADGTATGNKYLGNLSITKNGAPVVMGFADFDEISGNLTLNSVDGISLGKIKFTGNTNGAIEQLGSQAITIAELTMQKINGANSTLNDPVSVTGMLNFTSGNIISSTGKELVFTDNSNYTGAGNSSFADGPVTKTGDDAFTFPVGKLTAIAPISITAPLLTTDAFTAAYFASAAHNSGYDSTLKDPTIHHIASGEYWLLNRTAGTSAAAVTLSWQSSRSGVVNNLTDLRVVRWNGTMWKDEGNGGTAGDASAGTVITAAAVNNFSPFTLASATLSNPLPVQLVNFTAGNNNGMVTLQWITENEINLLQYVVERSTDGVSFINIATVKAKGATGRLLYSANDNSPHTGLNYYRLKMQDINGTYKYSAVIKLDIVKNFNVSIWPNPAHDYIIVNAPDHFRQIQLTAINGKLVKQLAKSANNRYNIAGLVPGMYFVRLVAEKESCTLKLFIE